jgi:ribosomal protein RSM22 (predicted rRNA methylase)
MNALPEHIQLFIQEQCEKKGLKSSYAALSQRYRQEEDKRLASSQEYGAYLAARLPATYAVNVEVLRRLQEKLPDFRPTSVLDGGSGPGTVVAALCSTYDSLKEAALVELDDAFINISKKLLSSYPISFSWQKSIPAGRSYDLVYSSYMLSELASSELLPMVQMMSDQAKELIVLVDTGTPHGFAKLMQARSFLVNQGLHLVAPCPHRLGCPSDWCHFSVRLPRTALHRQIKDGERGFEDEKFCYLIASKGAHEETRHSRLIQAPLKRSGHVHLTLCTPNGTCEKQIVSKKSESYKQAKKAEWGDTF